MADRIRALLTRFVEWWKRFSRKQKIVIISAIVAVIIAIVILVYAFTRPTMVTIANATTAAESATIKELLDSNSIEYELSDDALVYKVKSEDESTVRLLLGSNKIPTTGYSIDDVLDGSFSTTEADKKKRYQVYLEDRFSRDIATINTIKSARINLSIPNDDGTLIANKMASYANVVLELTEPMEQTQAAGIAKYIATGLGNDTTENITILDTDGNILFAGGDEVTMEDIASSNQKVRQEAETLAAAKVKRVLAGSGNGSVFNNVEIGINLDMSFSTTDTVDYHYYVDEGQTQGYLDSRTQSQTETINGVAGVPGTDSNDDTTYVLPDNEVSRSTSSEIIEDFLPSETITTTKGEVGIVNYENSTISVVAYNNVIYNEDQLKADGTLDDMTFDEFRAQNEGQQKVDVDPELVAAVSNATRIPEGNITILAYDVPMFQYSEGGRDWTDWLQIALAVLIIAMLGFVVMRTLRREEEEEVEEEVTVEDLMVEQEDEESDLEAVRFSEKSEARLMIEQFVDERPEAVASLLRNWLNEEWGE